MSETFWQILGAALYLSGWVVGLLEGIAIASGYKKLNWFQRLCGLEKLIIPPGRGTAGDDGV